MTLKCLTVAVFLSFLVGCSSKTKTGAQIEQRDLFDGSNRASFEQGQDTDAEAQRQAAAELKAQQDELRRELEREEQRLTDEQNRASSQQAVQDEAIKRANQISNELNALDTPLAERSIFYDFDSSKIKPEYQPIVNAHGRFLKKYPEVRVRIEGNCDDRGSREYNIALGQSRAEQIKQAFVVLGARPDQIDVVSYGAERPLAFGTDPESRSKNRRSDLVYLD